MNKPRYQYIGGSEISGVINISKWESPLSIWHRKRFGGEKEVTDAMYFGTQLEVFVKNEFKKRNKNLKVLSKKQMRDEGLESIEHEEFPFIAGKPDGYFVDEKGKIGLLEIKTCNEFAKDEWVKGIPEAYYAQVQYYLGITNLKTAWICCLAGGNTWYQHKIERSDDYVAYLFEKAIEFWNNYILTNIAPIPTDKDCDKKILGQEIIRANKKDVFKTTYIDQSAKELEELKAKEKALKKEIALRQNKILDNMSGHSEAQSHKFNVKYKTYGRASVDSKKLKSDYPEIYEEVSNESQSARLIIKEIKNV